jgi:HD superfamily phosphohydrolase
MDIVDPLHGRMRFTGLAGELLFTPEIQRLREVRLANIDLVQFPGFAEISRFQHSAGVAHLAGEAAAALGLSRADTLNLVAAALYHDAASPPFGHAMEAVLKEHYGYDHEAETVRLIRENGDGGAEAGEAFFAGAPVGIGRVVRRRRFADQGADCARIAELAGGQGALGPLIQGTMDLDNIDNVYRAAMAMGISQAVEAPRILARSFRLVRGRVGVSETAVKFVRHWQRTRRAVYGALLADAYDFSLQGMLKHALEVAVAPADGAPPLLHRWHWRLTDVDLAAVLAQRRTTKAILDRMRLGRVYPVIGFYRVDDPQALEGSAHDLAGVAEGAVKQALGLTVYTHLWYDHRYRRIDLPVVREFPIDLVHATPGTRPVSTAVVLGVLAAERASVSPAERRRVKTLYEAAFGHALPEQSLPIETPAPDEEQLALTWGE